MNETGTELRLHNFHAERNGFFQTLNGREAVARYADAAAEYNALRDAAGVMDLSFRSRLCVLGADRQRFLNGQVTNNVKDLQPGQGCYAALVNSKGKMESDLNIFCLENELLLDFEPGLSERVAARLEKYIIADDVQIVDVAPLYGLISVQGPGAGAIARSALPQTSIPEAIYQTTSYQDERLGEIYLANHPRMGSSGYDLFVPADRLLDAMRLFTETAGQHGGRLCGWQAFEMARIESGIPRFGVDIDETNLAPEAGIESRAISYTKGCYIGQEVIARIRTYGQVAKRLCRLEIDGEELPRRGDKLFREGKESGYVTSAVFSPALKMNIALGYVRRECNAPGIELEIGREGGAALRATIMEVC
jgi:folate-binding protein YgfZ